MPRVLITGITGQDGRHLSQFLATKEGYQVFGLVHGQANPKIDMVQAENPALELVEGDLRDLSSLIAVVEQVQPDEVYNLGAISFVQLSFKQAELTAEITGLGVLRMLEAVRIVGGSQNNPIRFYQASSSEMFGKVHETPQTETTPFHPRSPYGVAKVFGHYTTMNYREAYGIHASSGILFNHEGPRRGLEFVTRKVTNAVARIKLGLQEDISLGNLESSRDWGYAGDYVEAMWMMLQADEPDDFVIATGENYSVRDFLDEAFSYLDLDWNEFVETDPRYYRPAEVDLLLGDAAKARRVLGWKPKVGFRELVRLMVDHDLNLARLESLQKANGKLVAQANLETI
jgi:GDPmannose 4,6-dehydratase